MIDPHDEPQPPHDGMGDEEPDAPDLPFDLAADADASVGEGDATDPALKPPPAPPETGVHPAIADSSTGASIDRALDAVVVHHPPPFATIEAAEAAVEAADAHPDPLPPHEESGIVVPFLPDERPPIQMIDLTVTVHGRTLIRNANIGIGHGEVVLLVGGSGTGKSVLSKILLGLITRDTPGFVITGRLLVHGRDILSGNLRETRRFGIVFQDYALFDELTPGENLDFAFDHSPVKWLPHERDRRLKRLTETLSLNLDTPISQSSGGERRRLAIARTLAYDPEIVLYDEPTTGLDPLNSERVAQLIGTSSRQFGKTCFVITHDYEYLRGVADRVLLLDPETRELVELDKEKATAGFVRDRLQSLAPPSTPQVSPVRKLARRVAGFFIGTSRVIEQAEGLPRSMLTWPFTIGLAVIGAVALAVLMMRGAAAAVVEPPVSIGLTGAFALGAALMLVARLRESRRHGLTSLLWLGVLVLGAMTVHGALAPMFGRDLLARASIAARNMPLELVGQFGANATTMFLMTVVPALWSLSQITRWRHAMTALSLIGATTMAFVLVSAGVSSLSQPKLVSSFALDVPSFAGSVDLPTLVPPGVWLLVVAAAFIVAGLVAPMRIAQQHWGARYYWHYFKLVAAGSSVPYLACAGFITGFVATFFIYRYFPFRDYTEPLIIDDILHAVGFILWRVLVPLVATVLIAARCGAAVAADIGNRVYTHQGDALLTFRSRPETYWGQNAMWAFLLGGPLLVILAFIMSAGASLVAFLVTHPDSTVAFWWLHFTWEIKGPPDSIWPKDFLWLIAKIVVCCAGTAAISVSLGMRRKESSVSVSRAITQTILWSTLFVLMTHLLFAFFEFREIKPPVRH